MRRFMVTLAMFAVLSPTWALADDQETAQEIAQSLRNSGRLSDYSIGVKYQEGTAWLSGRVASKEQMVTALAMAKNLPQVNRVINNLDIQPSRSARDEQSPEIQQASLPQRDDADFEPQPVARPAVRNVNGTSAASKQMARKPAPVGTPITKPGSTSSANRAPADGRSKPNTFVPQQARQMAPNQRLAMNNKAANARMQDAGMPVSQDAGGGPLPAYVAGGPQAGIGPARYDQPYMPNHAWPAYAAYPNYAGVTYPRQYSPSAWPYIGPFYPYPQVPLGWRKVTMEWDDGWWYLDFDDKGGHRHGR